MLDFPFRNEIDTYFKYSSELLCLIIFVLTHDAKFIPILVHKILWILYYSSIVSLVDKSFLTHFISVLLYRFSIILYQRKYLSINRSDFIYNDINNVQKIITACNALRCYSINLNARCCFVITLKSFACSKIWWQE